MQNVVMMEQEIVEFSSALTRFPDGYARGRFKDHLWGATVKRSPDGKRVWLYAEDLQDGDIVSFNLYRLASGKVTLKPCEMSSEKVIAFVLGFTVA